jgi:hypothetical protein
MLKSCNVMVSYLKLRRERWWILGEQSLVRSRIAPADSALSRLPFFVPEATGVVESLSLGKWRIQVTSGHLALNEVKIANAKWTGDKTLNAGDSLDLFSAPDAAPRPKPLTQ